eukprot:GHVP01026086.1.p1 GENE.GHVP01026086.1~~GHVP01026086.1.p1  ORF type:complete len:842 (-),score=95.90 GHVP01026086.1:68-2593(-)
MEKVDNRIVFSYSGGNSEEILLSDVVCVVPQYIDIKPTGLEIYFQNPSSNGNTEIYMRLFEFCSYQHRESMIDMISKSEPCMLLIETRSSSDKKRSRINLLDIQKWWTDGYLSNFQYLSCLNSLSSRSSKNYHQYPVFPWIVSDYSSDNLDLTDQKFLRPLDKPIGAINEKRLHNLLTRRAHQSGDDRYLYGSLYSSLSYASYLLVRHLPEAALCLQGGKYDVESRMFCAMDLLWTNVTTNPNCFMELTPEFYGSDCSFLRNELDIVTSGSKHLDDVSLPPWSQGNAETFLQVMREALEGPIVSSTIHKWIDLIFGSSQKGTSADKHWNTFHPLVYATSKLYTEDLKSTKTPTHTNESIEDHVLTQMREFGQVPCQLFQKPHPQKKSLSRVSYPHSTWVEAVLSLTMKENLTINPATCDPVFNTPAPGKTYCLKRRLVDNMITWSSFVSARHLKEVDEITLKVDRQSVPLSLSIVNENEFLTFSREDGYHVARWFDISQSKEEIQDIREPNKTFAFVSKWKISAATTLGRPYDTYSSKRLLCGMSDGNVGVFDAVTMVDSHCHKHNDAVTSVSYLGQDLGCTGSMDQSVIVWDIKRSLDPVFICDQFERCVSSVSGSDGKIIASDSMGSVVICDIRVNGLSKANIVRLSYGKERDWGLEREIVSLGLYENFALVVSQSTMRKIDLRKGGNMVESTISKKSFPKYTIDCASHECPNYCIIGLSSRISTTEGKQKETYYHRNSKSFPKYFNSWFLSKPKEKKRNSFSNETIETYKEERMGVLVDLIESEELRQWPIVSESPLISVDVTPRNIKNWGQKSSNEFSMVQPAVVFLSGHNTAHVIR